MEERPALLKKSRKNLLQPGVSSASQRARPNQKLFGSFFQEGTSSYCLTCNVVSSISFAVEITLALAPYASCATINAES